MGETKYKLDRPMSKFDEGEVVRITARFGEDYLYDVRLEPVDDGATGSIKCTAAQMESATTALTPMPTSTRVP